MPEMMIFKAGKYPQGDWPKERVKKLVDAYDPEKSDAPLVIGHRWYGTDDSYQDAHGWVQSLRMDGAGKVYAVVTDVSADLKKKVAEKKLKYMSVEIYENDKVDATKPPYLRAIALLGRDTPAVAGVKLPAYFSLAPGGIMCFAKENEYTTLFTSKVAIKSFSGGDPETKSEVPMDELEKLRADFAAQHAQLATIQKENDELKHAGKKAESVAYFGKLRDEGKLSPALFDKAVALDTGLAEEQQQAFRALFGEMNQVVDLSGKHIAEKSKEASAGGGSTTLMAKIRAFQKEKHLASFEDAAEALYAEHPRLFEDGGAV
jgi:phage terminase Nu1 subunit (DNA packaging protein)